LGDGRSALVIYIPVPKVKNFQRVHSLLVSELEKKYNQTVVLLGQVRNFFFLSFSYYFFFNSFSVEFCQNQHANRKHNQNKNVQES
jgi:hypothetical protein